MKKWSKIFVIFVCIISLNKSNAQTRYSPYKNYSAMTKSVADNMKSIAATGEASGMKKTIFMKIGDSITKNSHSFGQLVCIDDSAYGGGHKGWEYIRNLGDHGYLYDAIEFFKQDTLVPPQAMEAAYFYIPGETGEFHYHNSSFNRDSKSARVGMIASWPLEGNPSPFAQEIEDIKPGFAIIMFGANDANNYGTDYEVLSKYTKNILNLVDSCINRGIIPILTATCPNTNYFDRTLTMSHITRCIAQGRQIPFVNFFLASMPLPNYGLSGDGVHPNYYSYNQSGWLTAEGLQYGYNLRNLITMQQLNNVYQIFGNNKDFVDAPTPALAGTGTSGDPFLVDNLAFVDFNSTSASEKEFYYQISLENEIRLRAVVYYQGSTDIDIELLDNQFNSLSADNGIIEQPLSAGTYYIKLNTVSDKYGEFQNRMHLYQYITTLILLTISQPLVLTFPNRVTTRWKFMIILEK